MYVYIIEKPFTFRNIKYSWLQLHRYPLVLQRGNGDSTKKVTINLVQELYNCVFSPLGQAQKKNCFFRPKKTHSNPRIIPDSSRIFPQFPIGFFQPNLDSEAKAANLDISEARREQMVCFVFSCVEISCKYINRSNKKITQGRVIINVNATCVQDGCYVGVTLGGVRWGEVG